MEKSSSESTATRVVSGIFGILAIVSVGLRFYSRKVTKAGVTWDDWWILISLLTVMLTSGILLWGMSDQMPFRILQANVLQVCR